MEYESVEKQTSSWGHAIKAAFPHTIPVLTGYVFMGMAFGILLQSQGYGLGWALLMSVIIYAGSMQFVAVELLTAAFNPINTIMVTLLVQARHIFYGFSMLGRLKGFGRKKPYMIHAMTDETFSLLYSLKAPEGVDEKRFAFCVSVMDQLYWITGCVSGAVIGRFISIDVQGIEFVMTALFVSILVEQFRESKNRLPAAVGVGVTAVCLLLFGSGSFLLPAMLLMVLVLTGLRKPLEAES